MNDQYLRKGIIGLARTLDCHDARDSSDRGWFAGHWPCAVIAAYHFCRNNPIEPGVDEAVTREVDHMMGQHPQLFADSVKGHEPKAQMRCIEDVAADDAPRCGQRLQETGCEPELHNLCLGGGVTFSKTNIGDGRQHPLPKHSDGPG
jgi:hypothetical protein